MDEEVNAIVLAGGKGNRIGRRKAFIKLGGRPLLGYAYEVASAISSDVVVVIGRDDDVEHFKQVLPTDARIVRDIIDDRGPIIGIYSGMKVLPREYTVVLPCDSPFIHPPALKYLSERAMGVDAAIPIWPNGYLEPLHSVYHTPNCLKAIESIIKERKFSILDMIERLAKVVYVPVEELRRFDKKLATFFNINSFDDLKKAENLLKNVRASNKTVL